MILIVPTIRLEGGYRFISGQRTGVSRRTFMWMAMAATRSSGCQAWEITAAGTAIRWPDVDEDIGVASLLGVPEWLVEQAAGFEIHDIG